MPGHPDQMAKILRQKDVRALELRQPWLISHLHLVSWVQEQKDWPEWLKAMNPEQLAEIKQAMEKFDVNGDGVIDRDDVLAAMKREGVDKDNVESELADFMRHFDKNGGVQLPPVNLVFNFYIGSFVCLTFICI